MVGVPLYVPWPFLFNEGIPSIGDNLNKHKAECRKQKPKLSATHKYFKDFVAAQNGENKKHQGMNLPSAIWQKHLILLFLLL